MRLSKYLYLSLLVTCTACFSTRHIKEIGIINLTNKDIQIETFPRISYNGYPEKFIVYHSKDSITWIYKDINAKIISPNWVEPNHSLPSIGYYGHYNSDSIKATYIMRPNSAFEIGWIYTPTDGELSPDKIKLNSLQIINAGDTILLNSKDEIWKVLTLKPHKTLHNKKHKRLARHYEMAFLIN